MTATQNQPIGEVFKKKREERNISLKEAENATSIRTYYLQAIEQGELNKVISPVYAVGFVKQYAIFLGMDGETVLKENPDIFKNLQNQEFDYGIGTLEVRDNPISGVKWFPNAMWIVAFVLMIAIAWYMAKFLEVI
jgi:cytoskeletal protein RodZ